MSLFSPTAWIARVLRIGSIVLLVIGLCPTLTQKGGHDGEYERWNVGIESSPLILYERSSVKELDVAGANSVTESSSFDFGLFSWSMAAVVGGVVLLALSLALRKAQMERAT